MFYIRADGNEKIGMGHVMRCLSIAEALKEQGEEVLFITADDKAVENIEKRGFSAKVLGTEYDNMEAELPGLKEILRTEISISQEAGETEQDNPKIKMVSEPKTSALHINSETGIRRKPKVLVDSYFMTAHYLEELKRFAYVILMDDEKRAVYPCDALVNYNIYGKTLGYEEDYPSSVKLFLGCDYMPLRKQFHNIKYILNNKAEHILFTTGGGDSLHIALALAKRLTEKEQAMPIWHILCGPYCTDVEELENIAEQSSALMIHKNVADMAKLMQCCDIAVSAAGSTLYELCSVGVPAVGFYFAENQRQNMEAFEKQTQMVNAGNYAEAPQEVLEKIEKAVEKLGFSAKRRKKISSSMKEVVGGKGAERLARALLESETE